MTRLFRALVVQLVCLAAAFTLAPASYADRVVHRDARHDVLRFSEADDDGIRVPKVRDPDVRRVLIAHRKHRVLIRLHFANIRGHRMHLQIAELLTSGGGEYGLEAVTDPRGNDSVDLFGDDGSVACPRLHYRIRYHRDAVNVTIPRRCLDTPSWLRVGIGAIRIFRNRVVFADDGLRNGIGDDLRMTRKLFRS